MGYCTYITKAGYELQAKLFAEGGDFRITRAEVGRGVCPDGTDPSALTGLVEFMARATSTKPRRQGCEVGLEVEYRSDLNGGLEQPFQINEFGVYAAGVDGTEILLLYGDLSDYPETAVPQKYGGCVRRYPVNITVGPDANASLEYPAGAWMTCEEVDEAIQAGLNKGLTLENGASIGETLDEMKDQLDAVEDAFLMQDGTSVKEAVADAKDQLNDVRDALRMEDGSSVKESIAAMGEQLGEMKRSLGQVGDILTTFRTDLGEDWLLCNGEAFAPEEYPALAELCPDMSVLGTLMKAHPIQSPVTLKGHPTSLATDGETVAMLVPYYTGNVNTTALIYSRDNFQTAAMVESPLDSTTTAPKRVYYVNGHWIIAAPRGICTAESLDKTLTDPVALPTSTTPSTVAESLPERIEYSNGEYHLCWIEPNKTPKIVHSPDPGFRDAEIFVVPVTVRATATTWKFARTSRHFVFIGMTNKKVSDVIYATDPLGDYTELQLETPDFGDFDFTGSTVSVANDRIFFGNGNASLGNLLGCIEDVERGEIKWKRLPYTSATHLQYPQVFWVHGKYVIFTLKTVASCLVLDGLEEDAGYQWTTIYPAWTSGATKFALDSGSPGICVPGRILLPANHGSYVLAEFPTFAVPAISPPQSYAYIKAR